MRWDVNVYLDSLDYLVIDSQNDVEVLVVNHSNERDVFFVVDLVDFLFVIRIKHFFVEVFWNFHTKVVFLRIDEHLHTVRCDDINVLHTHLRHNVHVLLMCICLNLYVNPNLYCIYFVCCIIDICQVDHVIYDHWNFELVELIFLENHLNTLPNCLNLFTFNLVYDYEVLCIVFGILNLDFHNQIHLVSCTRNFFYPKRFNLSTKTVR